MECQFFRTKRFFVSPWPTVTPVTRPAESHSKATTKSGFLAKNSDGDMASNWIAGCCGK